MNGSVAVVEAVRLCRFCDFPLEPGERQIDGGHAQCARLFQTYFDDTDLVMSQVYERVRNERVRSFQKRSKQA